MFENIDWVNVQASDFTGITNGAIMLNRWAAEGCCSDGKSAVWTEAPAEPEFQPQNKNELKSAVDACIANDW